MELRYHIERSDLAAAQELAIKKLVGGVKGRIFFVSLNAFVWALGTIAVLAAIDSFNRGNGFGSYFAIASFGIAALLVYVTMQAIWRRAILKREIDVRGPFPIDQTLTLTDSGLSLRDHDSELILSWAIIYEAIDLPIGVALATRSFSHLLIPNRAFADASTRGLFIETVCNRITP